MYCTFEGTISRAVKPIIANVNRVVRVTVLSAVNTKMPRQVALLGGSVVAVGADIYMASLQCATAGADLVARAVVAVRTCKRLLSSVQPQVHRQVALLGGFEVAVLAAIWLLSSVQPQVLRQAALVARAEVAVLALVDNHGDCR